MTVILRNLIVQLRSGVTLYKAHLGILAGCAFLGLVVASVPSNSVQQDRNSSTEWSLPVDEAPSLVSGIDTMLAKPLFGGKPVIVEATKKQVEDDLKTREDWRLIGIIAEGETRQAVIFNQATKKLESAQVGETLPGGETLTAILENMIEYNDESESESVSLFRDIESKED